MSTLVKASGIEKKYVFKKHTLHALRNIDLSIEAGKTLGLVGESGCGKSTLGKILLQLERPTAGTVFFQEHPISQFSDRQLFPFRRHMQMIFQDPYASLDPRMTVEACVGEGIAIHQLARGEEKRAMIVDLLQQVGLSSHILSKYPLEFSGGQRQRIAVARALAVAPKFVVCDEPLSALDVCTQQQVMELLLRLKQEKGLTYLFISHDLKAVKTLSEEVAVMYFGKVVEHAPKERLYASPLHPYTQALLSRQRVALKGEAPSPLKPLPGCPFHTRCPRAQEICKREAPELRVVVPGHTAACHFLSNASVSVMSDEISSGPKNWIGPG